MINRHVFVVTLLALSAATHAAVPIAVAPTQLQDDRLHNFAQHDAMSGALTITLHISGEQAKSATSWGKLTLTEAVDDTQTDLRNKDDALTGAGGEEMQKLDRPSAGNGATGNDGSFDIQLHLQNPPRGAKSLASIKGSFQILTGGKEQIITVKQLKSHRGQLIADPTLQAAHLTAKLAIDNDPSTNDDASTLPLQLTGQLDEVSAVEINDGTDTPPVQGESSNSEGDTRRVGYILTKPLDDTMVLRLHLVTGQQTVTVPIELKGIELP